MMSRPAVTVPHLMAQDYLGCPPGLPDSIVIRDMECGVQYVEYIVAPRAYWKGYLKLSLVSCPIALYPATFEREKISFHQLHKQTGNRIKYRKVDAERPATRLNPPISSRATRSARASTWS